MELNGPTSINADSLFIWSINVHLAIFGAQILHN